MSRYEKENRFLHGGDYSPEQWLDYPNVLKQDLALMKEAHINTITVGVFSWASLEPQEGVYDFSWLDQVFEDVHQMGGNVILATPSGGRPQWLSEAYPEVNRTNQLGQKHQHGFRHNHCYSSPVYRQKVGEMNQKLAERYGNHPALLMWHVSNEYSGECFCDYCQENWRDWLKNKYGSLEAINHAWWMPFWSHTYSSWEQVLPPSPLGESKNHGMDLDWKRFNTDMTIDFFLNEVKPLKALTPDVPVTTNFMAEGHDQHDFITLEGIDYGKFAQYVDVVSWDSYPDWHNPYESLAETAMKSAYVHDHYYSLKQQPFLVMESTPSFVNWHQFNKSKRPGAHILTAMQQIAHGSDSTLYFQWRQSRGNSEKYHGSVVSHDHSNENRVFKEVAEYGRQLEVISEIKGAKKDSRVAIIYDWDSNWALKRGGGFGRPTRRYPQTLQDHYSVFWKQDIAVDIITSDQDFSQYDLILAPMLYLMTEETMAKLSDYVQAGGQLVSSYFTGMVNETDLVNIGGWPQRLQDLFGLTVTELETLYPEETNIIFYNGKTYATQDYSAILSLKTADAIGHYQTDFYKETPAVTTQSFGQGKTYYLAARTGRDFLADFYATIIDDLALTRNQVITPNEAVSVQSRIKNGQRYYFVMNFSDEKQSVQLKRVLKDILNEETLAGELQLDPYAVLVLTDISH